LGERVAGSAVDVSDERRVERFFAQVGGFDHLVCTASDVALGPVVDSDSAPARALVESKLWGQHYAVKHGAPQLGRDPSITLFSGTVSARPMEGAAAYAAAAVEALTRVLALELRPVRVNTVVPGVVDTPAWGGLLGEEQKATFFDRTASSLPVGRIGRPEEIADAVLFLIKNGFVSGTTLVVDGGHRLV
jgi:NAD(P)-dependent dehydrogenase (short-subunit alcohol dehydrogenase family)